MTTFICPLCQARKQSVEPRVWCATGHQMALMRPASVRGAVDAAIGRPWDERIVDALRAAGRPMTAAELTDAVLGEMPNPQWLTFQNAMRDACDRGVVVRIGSAPRGADRYRYDLPAPHVVTR